MILHIVKVQGGYRAFDTRDQAVEYKLKTGNNNPIEIVDGYEEYPLNWKTPEELCCKLLVPDTKTNGMEPLSKEEEEKMYD